MNLFKLAWKNLTAKPLSMLLSLVLFALGVGMISILFLINEQVQDKFKKNLAGIDLVIGAKGSPLQMILCNMYHVDNPTGNITIGEIPKLFRLPEHPLLEMVVPISVGDSYSSRRIVGTTHDYPELYDAKIAQGKLWEKTMEASIGAEVAKFAKLKIGDTFFSSHGFESDGINEHDHGEFKVVGIFEPTGSVIDQLILTNTQSIWSVHEHEETPKTEEETDDHDHDHDHSNETAEEHAAHSHDDHDHAEDEADAHAGHDDAQEEATPQKRLMEYEEEDITSVLVKWKNNKSPVALNMARNINEGTDLQSASPAYEMSRIYDNMSVGENFLRSLALIIVFVSGLSVFISLFNSLRDRKYELSLMRVMGASRGFLFLLIILEGLLLAVLGYILGMLVSHLSMGVFANYMQDEFHYSFSGSIFLKEEVYLFFGSLLVGFVAAVIPALQAFKTDISETLTDS